VRFSDEIVAVGSAFTPGQALSFGPPACRLGGALWTNPPRVGPKPHHGGTPLDVLYTGQRSPSDHHRRGPTVGSPFLVHLSGSSIKDTKRCGHILARARATHEEGGAMPRLLTVTKS
jgi:hypothetical protein